MVSRDLLTSVGGNEELSPMKDLTVAQRLKGLLNTLPFTLTTSMPRYESSGWLLQGAKNIWRLMRSLTGSSAESLARDYDRY